MFEVAPAVRRRWIRYACPDAQKNADGSCLGLSRSEDDDEPHEICKACTKLGIEVDE